MTPDEQPQPVAYRCKTPTMLDWTDWRILYSHKLGDMAQMEAEGWSIEYAYAHPPTSAASQPDAVMVTDEMVEHGCRAAFSECDLGPFPEMAITPDSDRQFIRAALEAALGIKK